MFQNWQSFHKFEENFNELHIYLESLVNNRFFRIWTTFECKFAKLFVFVHFKKKSKTFKSIPTSLFRKYTRLVTGTYNSLPKVQIKNKTVKTAQKMKFSINDFFRIIRIWSYVLKKPLMEKFIFCADQFGEACSKPFQTSEIELSGKIAMGWIVIVNTYRFRRSPSQMFFKIDVHKDFAIFTGKHLYRSIFLIFAKFLKTAFL